MKFFKIKKSKIDNNGLYASCNIKKGTRIIEYKGKTIVFTADLIPTAGHLPIPYVMGYDVRPLQTLVEKAAFLDLAAEKGYFLFMEHDPNTPLIKVHQTEKGVCPLALRERVDQ